MNGRLKMRAVIAILNVAFLGYASSAVGQNATTSGFSLDLSTLTSQKYQEKSSRDSDGESTEVKDIDASGYQLALSVSINKYDLTFQSRTLSPEGLDYFSKRTEMVTAVGYHILNLPWASLIFGYYRWSQTGTENTEDAPAAFVATNTALVFGFNLEPNIYTFSPVHRIYFFGQGSILTSLEKDRNIGNDFHTGLGYKFQEGKGCIALHLGYIQESFQAERLEKDLPTLMRSDSTYNGYILGLRIAYR